MLKGKLTIIFDDPFYKAIFEKIDGSDYYVAQVNLGASVPQMPEILNLVNRKYSQLSFYKTSIEKSVVQHVNPKRRQRLVNKAVKSRGISTKAQQALKKQFENLKVAKKKTSVEQMHEEKQARFIQKQEKRRAKHQGH
ncbi:DUF2992 family protein [Lactobacillus sp. XV13L]|nr:DUF2992 family protein [Lactobacillus sp. XV13L]